MGSAEAAELTKLAETTYRDVNIAFANELARFADARGLDVQRVIDAANSQPFSHIHRPGIAVGGHCIPVYPRFFLEGDPDATLPRAARAANEAMPAYAVERLAEALGGSLEGARVLILGVAYRGGVKETAFSGAFATPRRAARAPGAIPVAADPLYDAAELRRAGLHAVGRRDRSTPRSCRPTTRSTARSARPTCPAPARSSTGAACSTLRAFAGSGVALVRLGRPAG